jgi:hypothetical protein
MRFLDCFCALLIIVGSVLSQVENEFYYYDNIFYRVVGVTLMNGIYRNPTNHSLDSIMQGVNIVAITDFTGSNETGIGHNYLNNNENYTYKDIIKLIDFDSLGYSENTTNWFDIHIDLIISEENNKIRWVLFITTIISGK